eukprot:1950321-Amphidinium_carterae.1
MSAKGPGKDHKLQCALGKATTASLPRNLIAMARENYVRLHWAFDIASRRLAVTRPVLGGNCCCALGCQKAVQTVGPLLMEVVLLNALILLWLMLMRSHAHGLGSRGEAKLPVAPAQRGHIHKPGK